MWGTFLSEPLLIVALVGRYILFISKNTLNGAEVPFVPFTAGFDFVSFQTFCYIPEAGTFQVFL